MIILTCSKQSIPARCPAGKIRHLWFFAPQHFSCSIYDLIGWFERLSAIIGRSFNLEKIDQNQPLLAQHKQMLNSCDCYFVLALGNICNYTQTRAHNNLTKTCFALSVKMKPRQRLTLPGNRNWTTLCSWSWVTPLTRLCVNSNLEKLALGTSNMYTWPLWI